MRLSIQATMVMGVIFALLCLGVAVTGFASLGEITDPVRAADARGFAWFWTFLATVAGALALLAYRLLRMPDGDADR